VFNDEICAKMFNTIIKNYLNIDLSPLNINIKKTDKPVKVLTEKYKCENCGKCMSNITNYKNHVSKEICKKNKIIKCEECNKIFKDKRNLDYHIKNKVCFKKIINEDEPLQNKQAQTNIQTQNNIQNQSNIQTQNNTQNTQNIQNQNNIIISVNSQNDLEKVVDMLPFRNASYNIPAEKYLEYANNPEQAIKKFIKDYHFNPDRPERMNILNTNRRDNRTLIL